MEVSAEKPGNITPTHDFPNTRYHHFLSSAISLGMPMHKLAQDTDFSLGDGILEAVRMSHSVQKGGNTHLGTILLFAPLSKAAGKVEGDISERKLRNALVRVLLSTTNQDAIGAFNAINLAPVGGLNDVPKMDVRNHETLDEIGESGIKLTDWMRIGASSNSICYEYANDFRLTFDVGLPTLRMHAPTKMDKAIVHTFLSLLALREDTHITGKFGEGVAQDVKARAACILEKGSVWRKGGIMELKALTHDLRQKQINPGTTADLTATAIFVALLTGLEI